LPAALSDAAKVESQGNEAGIVQRSGSTEDDFVVHRPAAKWVRMKHESRGTRWALPRLFDNRFELSVPYRDKKVAGGIHVILTSTRSTHKDTDQMVYVRSFILRCLRYETRVVAARALELCR
jgi:hypothetical protein